VFSAVSVVNVTVKRDEEQQEDNMDETIMSGLQ
jgi:hypothetical protein